MEALKDPSCQYEKKNYLLKITTQISFFWLRIKTHLNSSSKLGPGCSKVALLSVHKEPSSGADGEFPARSVK